MTSYLEGLTGRDLGLSAVAGVESDILATELRRRPWWIHDLLGRADVFEKVIDRHAHPSDVVSPFLLFAVLMHKTAEDLREATYVNEWVGPESRMPLFDVLRLEFVADPGRTCFLTTSAFLLCGARGTARPGRAVRSARPGAVAGSGAPRRSSHSAAAPR